MKRKASKRITFFRPPVLGERRGYGSVKRNGTLRFSSLVISLFITVLGHVQAEELRTPMTGLLKGSPPEFELLCAVGTLEVGQTIEIDPVAGQPYLITDSDLDIYGENIGDISVSTFQFIRVPVGAQINQNNEIEGAIPLAAPGVTSYTLTADDTNPAYRIGFKIIPTSQYGLPGENKTLTVPDVRFCGSIDALGNIQLTENTFIEGGNSDGNVTQPEGLAAVIYLDPAREIPLGTQNIAVNRSYYLSIYKQAPYTAENDITHLYGSDDITWHLLEGQTAERAEQNIDDPEFDHVVQAVDDEGLIFDTQDINLEGQAQHSVHLSEQGLRLYAVVEPNYQASLPPPLPAEPSEPGLEVATP